LTKYQYMTYDQYMSPADFKIEKMNRNESRKLVRKIMTLMPQNVLFSKHALAELENDDLTTTDALNILKSSDSKIIDDGEFEHGSYRYRLETGNIVVVICFSSNGEHLIVVTAWDKRK